MNKIYWLNDMPPDAVLKKQVRNVSHMCLPSVLRRNGIGPALVNS